MQNLSIICINLHLRAKVLGVPRFCVCTFARSVLFVEIVRALDKKILLKDYDIYKYITNTLYMDFVLHSDLDDLSLFLGSRIPYFISKVVRDRPEDILIYDYDKQIPNLSDTFVKIQAGI